MVTSCDLVSGLFRVRSLMCLQLGRVLEIMVFYAVASCLANVYLMLPKMLSKVKSNICEQEKQQSFMKTWSPCILI